MLPSLLLAFAHRHANDIPIDTFESDTYRSWQVNGTAFGSGPAHGTLANQMTVSGFIGHGFVDSYNGGDASTGSMTSRTFAIERPYINFLIGGGKHPGQTCVNLIVAGKVVYSTTGRSTTPQDTETLRQATWNVSNFLGQKAFVQILDLSTEGWGHINADEIIMSDQPATSSEPLLTPTGHPYTTPKPEPIYHEKYRPQFHFSARTNWLNDPNGLVYYDGLYHLFFQHNPSGIQWGNMTWGHAVSKDLVHWHQQPDAIKPDALGTIFSGSAAVDLHNTTGFGTRDNPPLVAMYTAAGSPFTQCLAYSQDNGKTWTKYEKNPVLQHIVHENRDPRIFWYEPDKRWIMALYLDGDEFAIFGSPNLKSWTELSRLHLPGSSECPDLFEIPLEGSHETRWIFFGANYRYLVGSFDGVKFTPEQEPIQGDFGGNFYASQTYNHTPDHRRIQIGWMNGPGPFPNMPFNQQMSFPCELKLVHTSVGLRLLRTPVSELQALHGRKYTFRNETIGDFVPKAIPLHGSQFDISLRMKIASSHLMQMNYGKVCIAVDPVKHEIECLGHRASFDPSSAEIDLRILIDRSSLEVFVQGGVASLTSYLPMDFEPGPLSLSCLAGGCEIVNFEAFEVKSAW